MTDPALYPWLKALHIAAMVAWMASMLYLPRLFVYHSETAPGSPQSETFKVMERRLLKQISNPAMIAVWILGLWLAFGYVGFQGNGWLHAKLALVLLLSGLHGFFAKTVKEFARDANRRSAKFYRGINEVPAVLALIIIVLAVVKPF